MSDQFSEVTSESWLGRIGNSIVGVLVGLVLIPISICLLFWNESRGVTTAKSLKEAASVAVSVEADVVSPANNQKLVHVSGEATTKDVVSDSAFAISAAALRLTRAVDLYQWKEETSSQTTKKLGGGTETVKTFSYQKTWSNGRIDSSRFKQPEGHENSGEMIAQSTTLMAPSVTLGAFRLPESVIGQMKGDEPLAPTPEDLGKLQPAWASRAKLSGDGYFFGADPSAPAIGDQRVTFKVLRPAVFSVLAQQSGGTFAPYHTKAGDTIERVERGTLSAAEMFAHAASENSMLTWILRVAGFLVMTMGIGLIVSPISVFADVIPFLGNLLEAGVWFAASVVGLAGSLITIAVAWFIVRPVFSGVLIALALAGLLLGRRFGSRSAGAAPRA